MHEKNIPECLSLSFTSQFSSLSVLLILKLFSLIIVFFSPLVAPLWYADYLMDVYFCVCNLRMFVLLKGVSVTSLLIELQM